MCFYGAPKLTDSTLICFYGAPKLTDGTLKPFKPFRAAVALASSRCTAIFTASQKPRHLFFWCSETDGWAAVALASSRCMCFCASLRCMCFYASLRCMCFYGAPKLTAGTLKRFWAAVALASSRCMCCYGPQTIKGGRRHPGDSPFYPATPGQWSS